MDEVLYNERGEELEYSRGVVKTRSKSYRFPGVSARATVTASATVGVTLDRAMGGYSLLVDVEPFAVVGASASANVACAGDGVTGSVDVLDLRVPVALNFDLRSGTSRAVPR
jgi:hypothetical protein